MTKVNPENMKELYDKLFDIFCKKNNDYGDSFEKSLDKHGLVASVVRMEDKMNRLSTLARGDKDAQIASESLVDTLMDLANYAAMSACWLIHKDDDEFGDYISKGFSSSVETTTSIEEFKKSSDGILHDNPETHSTITDKGWKGHTIITDRENLEEVKNLLHLSIFEENLEEVKNLLHLSSFEGHQQKVNEHAYYDRNDVTDADASWKPAQEDIVNEPKQFSTKLKGLENGYFIRQHINSDNSYRYTIAFNPEGTIKTQDGEEKPYLIECFVNDYDGMNVWVIHVFDTQEDMVAALNYDLTVRDKFKSKNFGDSIKVLGIKTSIYAQHDAPKVFETWVETFGQAFDKNMTCNNLFSDVNFGILQCIKTFGIVFISEKTGALIVKGIIRERFNDINHNFIWFSDTKEVLLELKNTIPKFNNHGIIYGLNSVHILNGENYNFNPLYQDMEDKILSKFHSWNGSELKNLVFFNEDEALNGEFTEKKIQIPGYLSSKNGKLSLDLTDGKLY